ncbi:PREDICTED: extensin-like [Trachymyrmex septentrionalis]|nr:PREDICTED: extensin-like [Trachymyrmex septentrionalis]
MYLKSCCALFLLALVACQAAPSSQAIEKSINEAETFAKTNIELEGTGAEKDRAKKSATFCVEVHSGKPETVPCKQELRQETSKPLVIVQPISIPASVPIPTVVDYPKQPIVIHQHSQPQFVPQPAPQFIAPPPSPVPIKLPAPAPVSISDIPPTPASKPCDKPTIVQPAQSQVHTVHVIHSQPTPQPSKIERPSFRPLPQQSIVQVSTCKKCNRLIPSLSPPKFSPISSYSYGYPTTFTDVLPQYESTDCEVEPSFECNCRSENRLVELSPKIKIHDPRIANAVTIDSIDTVPFNSIPQRSSMISREHDPSISNIVPDQSMFFAPKGAREAEGKHHHRKPYATLPGNFNVEIPVAHDTHNYPPQYYSSYPSYPSYSSSNSYTYPSSYPYGAYGTYGTSYPVSYDSLASASNVPAITVNAGGPFYNPRESQLTDSSSQPNNEAQPRAFSTDIQSNYEQKEITQTDKESIIKEIIPETKIVTKK